MERVLIGMHGSHGCWEALSRAIALAKRMDARIYVLRVLEPGHQGEARSEAQQRAVRRLELIIRQAEADGIHVEYFIAEGVYETEVIKFIEQHRITLFVAETCTGEGRACEREAASLQAIRHRVSCRVELVTPRKHNQGPHEVLP